MANLTFIKKKNFENLFGMRGGYVLNFSNRTFYEFFMDSVRMDIWDSKYEYGSNSKANRLRAFWISESDNIVGKVLKDLLDYWASITKEISEQDNKIFNQCNKAVEELLGQSSQFNNNLNVISEDEFINKDFKNISIDQLDLDSIVTNVLKQRIEEIRKCLNAEVSLAVIFLCGSTLEGILLGIASKNPKAFNQSLVSPKDKSGKVKQFQDWTLSNFIDVAYSLNLLGEDVKKFSHSLRDFRNYIHPYQQISSKFNPSEHTAKICWQVMKAAMSQILSNKKKL